MTRYFILALFLCSISLSVHAQPKDNRNSTDTGVAAKEKTAKEIETERLLKERRANAQSLLINLAADARNFNDAITRARTLARVANALWDSDQGRARALFRLAWEAADIGEQEAREKSKTQTRATKSGPGMPYPVDPHVAREVMRLAARRDRALGEEFLADLKEQMRRSNGGALISVSSPMGLFDPLVEQRLDVARQVMESGQTEQALQFADPVLGVVSQWTVDFLSSLRERNALAADERYARMLLTAAADPRAEANTVSVLSSYLFTPHFFIAYTGEGTNMRTFPVGNRTPPAVARDLQLSFFRAATLILTRPLAPPGQEQTTSGHDGHYLVIKRLMPLFEQSAPPELTSALKAQLEILLSLVTKATRDRDDDDAVKTGIRPDKMIENWEKSLRDQLDQAKTSADRDRIYLQLASLYASNGDSGARDLVDEVADPETRKDAKVYVDIRLARYAVAKKDADRIIEIIRIGELDHIYKSWLYADAAKLLSKSDNDKALSLVEQAVAEARRISPSDPDAPRAFLAAANAMFLVNRSAVWETMSEAVKNANSADTFPGEGGELAFHLFTKGGPSYGSQESVPDFDLDGIFKNLANYDYEKSVELARGLRRESPRAAAVIAIARSVLEEKKK